MILDRFGKPAPQARYAGGSRSFSQRRSITDSTRKREFDLSESDRREIIRKSRYFVQNSLLASAIVESLVAWTVGPDVWTPVIEADTQETADTLYNGWQTWAAVADLTETGGLWEVLNLAARTYYVEGEAFFQYHKLTNAGARNRLRVQVHGSDEIGTDKDEVGIRVDKNLRPKTFVMHSGGTVDSSDMEHYYRRIWIGQRRGFPIFAPAINRIHDLDDILTLETDAVRQHSGLTAAIERDGDLDPDQTLALEDDSGNYTDIETVQQLTGASAINLRAGEKLSLLASSRPSVAWQGFVDYFTNMLVLSTGFPPAVLLGAKMGGADTRRDLAIASRKIREHQRGLLTFHDRTFRYWQSIEHPELKGKYSLTWIPPKSITADAGRESQQDREDYFAGLRNYSDHQSQVNQSAWRRKLKQRAEEVAYLHELAKEYGLVPGDILPAKPGTQATPSEK